MTLESGTDYKAICFVDMPFGKKPDKDRFREGEGSLLPQGHLDEAISVYTKGFEADPRDYYPGVNAINLPIQRGTLDALKEAERLVPLVSFALARRGGASSSDYWDVATVVELACLGASWSMAAQVLQGHSSRAPKRGWSGVPETTLSCSAKRLRRRGEALPRSTKLSATLKHAFTNSTEASKLRIPKGAIAIPTAFGWKDQDWAELLACVRRRKVIPVVGEELLQVEIKGETVPLYTWMAKRLASQLDLSANELPSPPSLNNVASRYLTRSDSNRNTIYMRLCMIIDEAKANLRAPMPLRQLAEITDFSLFLTTTFDSLVESALNEIRKRETESLTYSPTDRQDLPAGKDLLPPTVYHLFGTLDVSPTYVVSREDILEWIHAMESQPRPKNLFDELRQNYMLILGAQFSDWLPWFLRLRVEKRLSETRDWFDS